MKKSATRTIATSVLVIIGVLLGAQAAQAGEGNWPVIPSSIGVAISEDA